MGPVGGKPRLPPRVLLLPSDGSQGQSDSAALRPGQEGGPPERAEGPFSEESSGQSSGGVQGAQRAVGFLLHLFPYPEEDGGVETDLEPEAPQWLYAPRPFRMETLSAILTVIQPGGWGATLDLKDAYLHVPMHESARRWLRFYMNGAAYEFRVLPFGLSAAPRTFTRVVKSVAEFLRRGGIQIFVYLDDWLIVAPTPQLLQRDILTVCELVSRLGFLINHAKSKLVPTQRILYLGAVVDLRVGRVYPSEPRVAALVACASQLLGRSTAVVRAVLRLLGLMASMVDVVPLCRMHMRPLQLHLLQSYRAGVHPLDRVINIPGSLRPTLQWWASPGHLRVGVVFPPPQTSLTLTTDASKQGWGAHLLSHRLSGLWSPTQARYHINILELWAVFLSLRRLSPLVAGKRIAIRSDSMTVVAYINKQGGTRSVSLCREVSKLLRWCTIRGITLLAVHLPGRDNVLADALSRRGQGLTAEPGVRGASVEWRLDPRVCNQIFSRLDRPHIDLFASHENYQLPNYFSRKVDQGAVGWEALSLSWAGLIGYAFPPIALIPRVLNKVAQTDSCVVLLIAPWWPRQTWFVLLTSLLIREPVRLPEREGLLSLPAPPWVVPLRTIQSLHLAVWTISSSHSKRRDFLRRLPSSQERQGDLQPDTLTIRGWSGFTSGAGVSRLIRSEQL
jgi:hypothetical protein